MFPLNTVIAWHKTYYEHSRYDNKNTFYYLPLGHISFRSSVDQVIFKIDQVKVQAQDGRLGEITCLKLVIHMVIMVM